MTKSQTPLVKAGTVLSIGTVKSIENNCVRLVYKGMARQLLNEFTASFTAIEKIFFEEK